MIDYPAFESTILQAVRESKQGTLSLYKMGNLFRRSWNGLKEPTSQHLAKRAAGKNKKAHQKQGGPVPKVAKINLPPVAAAVVDQVSAGVAAAGQVPASVARTAGDPSQPIHIPPLIPTQTLQTTPTLNQE